MFGRTKFLITASVAMLAVAAARAMETVVAAMPDVGVATVLAGVPLQAHNLPPAGAAKRLFNLRQLASVDAAPDEYG